MRRRPTGVEDLTGISVEGLNNRILSPKEKKSQEEDLFMTSLRCSTSRGQKSMPAPSAPRRRGQGRGGAGPGGGSRSRGSGMGPRMPPPRAQAEAPAGEAGAAAGPAAGAGCPVPLPTKGPQAAPGWVRAAVAAAPWRGGLEPAGEQDVELSAAEVTGAIPADLVGQVRAPPPGGRAAVFSSPAARLTRPPRPAPRSARRRRPSGAAPGGCGSGPTGTRTGSTGTA